MLVYISMYRYANHISNILTYTMIGGDNMQYTDREVCEKLNMGVNGLKRVRFILRQMGLLEERERVNDEKILFIEKIVNKQRQTGGTYENAIKQVLDDERRESLLSIFQENDGTFSIDIFLQVLRQHYENADEVLDTFLNSFVHITDILRTIGDQSSVVVLDNIQESIINTINFKFLYQHGRIKDS